MDQSRYVKAKLYLQVVGEEDCHPIVFEGRQTSKCIRQLTLASHRPAVKLTVGAKPGQAIFSERAWNRIASFAKLLADLAPKIGAGIALVHFLKMCREE